MAEQHYPCPIRKPSESSRSVFRTIREEERKQQRRRRRHDRYERVVELHRLGHTQKAISLKVGIQRKTIRRWLRAGQFPERKPVTGRRSHIREFHDYLQTTLESRLP